MSGPIVIPLRAKYRRAVRGRYKSRHNQNGPRTRNKIGHERHIARFGKPPLKIMVLTAAGKVRMEVR